MRRLLVCFGLLAVLPVLWPSEAAGQKQKKNAPKLEDATDEDYAQLRKLKDISGILTAFNPEAKALTLRVEYQTYEPIPLKPNPRAGQQYNNLVRQQQRLINDYNQIMRAKNPAQQQRMQRFMMDYQRFQTQAAQMGVKAQYKTVAHAKEFDFDVSPEVKVARAKPPMEYDDKGNVKEYTKEELKKMRDPDMPGYTAKTDDLQAGQTVKLYLGKPKAKKSSPEEKKETDDPKAKADGPAKKTDEPAKKPGEAKTDEKKGPQLAFVRQILIQADADPDFQKTRPKKKRKDDQ